MSDFETILRQTVDVQAWACETPDHEYVSVEDFVLDQGYVFHSDTTLTLIQRTYLEVCAKLAEADVLAATRRRLTWTPQECFRGALALAAADDAKRIEYCEGFVKRGACMQHHAWNTFDGVLIDLTRALRPDAPTEFYAGETAQHDLRDRVLGKVPDGWCYFGRTFDAVLLEDKEAGSVILDPDIGALEWSRVSPRDQLEVPAEQGI